MEKKDDFYVYLHRRGDNNEVFYVGKGRRYRAKSDTGRNIWWQRIKAKYGFVVEYVEKGLSEEDAFTLEIELIKFYRNNNHTLCNLSSGGEGASGCTRSEEHKRKIGESKKGYVVTDYTKNKMAEQGFSVFCSNGMLFPSARRAANWLRLNTKWTKARYDGILATCRGTQKYAYGFTWSFV